MKNKFLISLPHIYPICPLNLNHAKMFVIADVMARWQRSKGKEVYFPIASHYSGVTTLNVAENFKNISIKKWKNLTSEEKSTIFLYREFYKTPSWIFKKFNEAVFILDYFSQEIIQELKDLNVSCDFNHFYSTRVPQFSSFVKAIFKFYQRNKKIIQNKRGSLSLNYDEKDWRKAVEKQIKRTDFIQEFYQEHILSAMKNIHNEWSFERNYGLGVKLNSKTVIDPMFDSELFPVFDLFWRVQDLHKKDGLSYNIKFFEQLFTGLKDHKQLVDCVSEAVINRLPVDVFVAEEHLKNWLVKRFFGENLLLHHNFHTKNYFILGMGLLDGKSMSASQGHAVLSKDLIEQYGGMVARLTLLLTGGHPSKTYDYVQNLPLQARNMLREFFDFLIFLKTVVNTKQKNRRYSKVNLYSLFKAFEKKITNSIEIGYFRQAVIEILVNFPKEVKGLTSLDNPEQIFYFLRKYLSILLPQIDVDSWNDELRTV